MRSVSTPAVDRDLLVLAVVAGLGFDPQGLVVGVRNSSRCQNSCASTRPPRHRPGSTLWPAATARSVCVVTNHDDHPVAAPPLRRSGWSLTSAWAAAVAAVGMCASAERVPRRQRAGAAPAPLLTPTGGG